MRRVLQCEERETEIQHWRIRSNENLIPRHQICVRGPHDSQYSFAVVVESKENDELYGKSALSSGKLIYIQYIYNYKILLH